MRDSRHTIPSDCPYPAIPSRRCFAKAVRLHVYPIPNHRLQRCSIYSRQSIPTRVSLGFLDWQRLCLPSSEQRRNPTLFLLSDYELSQAFAIPSISQVSVGAKEMVDRAGKRYADTTVLVGEWIVNPLDSERARLALNRVNYIHSRYGNKIRDDQMVYTLCLLVSEALVSRFFASSSEVHLLIKTNGRDG